MSVAKAFCIINIVLASVSILLTGVALISAANNNGVLTDLPWSVGSYSNSAGTDKIYVGIYELGQKYTFGDRNDDFITVNFADDHCGVSFCNNCETNQGALLAFVVIFMIAALPAALVTCRRYTDNSALMRNISIICNVIALIAGCIGMIIFAAGCEKSVKKFFSDDNLTWTYGPAFGLLAAVSVMKAIEIVLGFLMGVETGGAAAANNQM